MDNTKFTVSYYGLKTEVEAFFEAYSNKLSFQIPLSAFISLSIAILTSECKPLLGLTKDQVQIIMIMAYIGTIVWLLFGIYKYFRSPVKNIDQFCTKLMKEAINNNFEATCLFLIKMFDKQQNTYKILCFHHIKSDCYYLPYVLYDRKKTIPQQLDDIQCLLSNNLCIQMKHIKINYLQPFDMWYQRFSARKNSIITYDNKVFSAEIERFPEGDKFTRDFTSLGRSFCWLPFETFKDSLNTAQNNAQVIKLIEENNLFLRIPFSFVEDGDNNPSNSQP